MPLISTNKFVEDNSTPTANQYGGKMPQIDTLVCPQKTRLEGGELMAANKMPIIPPEKLLLPETSVFDEEDEFLIGGIALPVGESHSADDTSVCSGSNSVSDMSSC